MSTYEAEQRRDRVSGSGVKALACWLTQLLTWIIEYSENIVGKV